MRKSTNRVKLFFFVCVSLFFFVSHTIALETDQQIQIVQSVEGEDVQSGKMKLCMSDATQCEDAVILQPDWDSFESDNEKLEFKIHVSPDRILVMDKKNNYTLSSEDGESFFYCQELADNIGNVKCNNEPKPEVPNKEDDWVQGVYYVGLRNTLVPIGYSHDSDIFLQKEKKW